MAFIPLPNEIDFQTWAAVVVETYANEGMPEGVPPEDDWKEWGIRIMEVNELEDLPYTHDFATWRAWAERVVESLY